MTYGPLRPVGTGDDPGYDAARSDDRSLGAVHRSDVLLDALADRAPLGARPGGADPLPAILAGWVTAIDEEVAVALSSRAVPTRDAAAAEASVRAGASADPVDPVDLVAPTASGPRPVRAGPATRQWRVLSASAAAVIAVLAVGVGLQDTAQVGPDASTVAESVQSIEATLVASMLAAEAGDVDGARVLLEQARAMVESLPEDQRMLWETAIGHTERGLRSAEEAVRRGQPVPALVGLVPGVDDALVPGASGQEVGRARLGEKGALPQQPAAGREGGAGQGDGGQVGTGQGGGAGQGAAGEGSGQGGQGGSGQGSGSSDGSGSEIGQGTGQGVDRDRPDRGATTPPVRPSTTPATTTPSTPRATAPGRPPATPTTTPPATPTATPTATPSTRPSTRPTATRPTTRPTAAPTTPDSPRATPTRRPAVPGEKDPGARPGTAPGGGQGATLEPRGGRDDGQGQGAAQRRGPAADTGRADTARSTEAGRSTDVGRSTDAGRSEDAGRSADAGRSEDAGPSDDTGRSTDAGPSATGADPAAAERTPAGAGAPDRPAVPGRSGSQP